jgi:hypothetical protein
MEDAKIDIEAAWIQVATSPARAHHSLGDLLNGINQEAMRDAVEGGDDASREVAE